ncbi:MAG TPA: MotA/TolQ/ExbB proton channel family protein [Chthoniobacterales bacterium]
MIHLALFDNTLDFFAKGGIFMGVLLACSFVAVIVILLRLIALRRAAVIPPLIEKEINKIKPGDEPEHLRHLIQDDSSPLSRIVEVAVRPYNSTKQETMEVVQSRARQQIVRLESGLFILEIVVGIAPLLGLLGAVTGLVRVFGNIGSGAMSTSDLKGIASGIGEALSTTIVGLSIAIPALVAFSYFSRRVERLAVEMESLMTELVEKIFHGSRTPETFTPESNPLEGAAR